MGQNKERWQRAAYIKLLLATKCRNMAHRYLAPTVGSPAHIISPFKLSPHICKRGRCNVATSTCVYPVSSDKVVGSSGTRTASFMYLRKKKSSGVKSGEQGGQVIGLCVLISFPQKLSIQKVQNCTVKM